MLLVDSTTHSVIRTVDHLSPPHLQSSEPTLRYGAAVKAGDGLLTCSATEVLHYDKDLRLDGQWSHPWMNSVHHALPLDDGGVLVTATGLDMVLDLAPSGDLRKAYDLADEPAFARFDRNLDFRRVNSTKPHYCHINYLFRVDGRLFATRFQQRDAVNIQEPGERFDIAVGGPHDGVVHGQNVYFTTTDGRVLVFDSQSRRRIGEVTLGGQDAPLGWCRGLYIFEERYAWVGFSRLRPTRIQENIAWLRQWMSGDKAMMERPTRIALYDLHDGACLDEILLEPFGLNAVYGIVPHGAASAA